MSIYFFYLQIYDFYLAFPLSVCPSVRLSVCLPACLLPTVLPACLSVQLEFICLSVSKSASRISILSICLPVYLSIYPSVCLFLQSLFILNFYHLVEGRGKCVIMSSWDLFKLPTALYYVYWVSFTRKDRKFLPQSAYTSIYIYTTL